VARAKIGDRYAVEAGVACGLATTTVARSWADHFQHQIEFWGMAPRFAFVAAESGLDRHADSLGSGEPETQRWCS
jgi:hypothetical protein